MLINYYLFIVLSFIFVINTSKCDKRRKVFDPEKYAKKSVYNAVDRVRHKITTTPSTTDDNNSTSKEDKNIMRTMAIIEAKSADGRLVMLFCNDECLKHRRIVPLWIREFNTKFNLEADPISYHYHHRKNRFGYYDVDELLDRQPVVLVYFVAHQMFVYEQSMEDKDQFVDFLNSLEIQPIQKPRDWKQLDQYVTAAANCDSGQKYVIRIHHLVTCKDELWENLARSFHSSKNITFIELQAPLSNEETVIIQKRLPHLQQKCQILAVLHNGGYEELFQTPYLKDLNRKISTWQNENCTDPETNKILPPLSEIQMDYFSEDLTIQSIAGNKTHIIVGLIGGLAVIALAISIFWGLNGSSFK